MNTNIIKWVIVLLIVFALAFFIYAAVKINQPLTTTSHPQDFEIKKGETSGEIARGLNAADLIANDLLFKIYLRFKNSGGKLQAGTYVLDSKMSIAEIVEILTAGKVKSQGLRVTIIEGWNIAEIASELERQGLSSQEEFTKAAGRDFSSEFEFLKIKPARASLEGFLFPDTYIFKVESGAEAVARKMLLNFGRKVDEDLRAEIQKQNKNFYEVLILASVIEREVGRNVKKGTVLSREEQEKVAGERRIVAGIFWKRLGIGMPLESDATIGYITGSKRTRATLEETKIDSPYNTYRYRGLPPGPISNPSLDAIKAAVNPAKTDYLFFLTASDGEAYFARTLEEHIQNREKYLE